VRPRGEAGFVSGRVETWGVEAASNRPKEREIGKAVDGTPGGKKLE